jgi:hypothetical protein
VSHKAPAIGRPPKRRTTESLTKVFYVPFPPTVMADTSITDTIVSDVIADSIDNSATKVFYLPLYIY